MPCRQWILSLVVCASFAVQAQESKSPIANIESLIRAQSYDQAMEATRSALKQSPRDYRLWTLEGIVLSIQGNHPEALMAFDKALSLSPTNMAALKGKAELLYEKQDKRAVPVLEQILRGSPKDEIAHGMLAMLEAQQGDCPEAISHFQLSENATRTQSASLAAYGSCFMQLKQPERAVPVFQQLVSLLPDNPDAKYDLAVALVESHQNDEALKLLEPMVAASQADPDVLSLASEAYEAKGDTPKAVALLRQAIVLSPSTPGYYVSFAIICLEHDSFQVGIDMIDAGLQHVSADPSLYISRGLLYVQLAKYKDAEADFQKADALDSTQSLGSYATDLAEIAGNDPQKALANVRVQLRNHPSSPYLHFVLAKILWSQGGASEEAEREVLTAIKLKPDMVPAHDLLADIYMREEKFDRAIEQSRIALKELPSDQSALFHLIMALRHGGPAGQREIPGLVKQLSSLKQSERDDETNKMKFKLVEQKAPAAQ
ncbi:tetratricopeptide repeat protein [Silvibacterium acidisoli]|uniref:tetratricopeptide repeat protein n=1 Tax=Acidobacteriaceae bacterium ZG23-2 TaxID=2883246 RepID=UPI00406CB2B3